VLSALWVFSFTLSLLCGMQESAKRATDKLERQWKQLDPKNSKDFISFRFTAVRSFLILCCFVPCDFSWETDET
jgi:hypothetical protein